MFEKLKFIFTMYVLFQFEGSNLRLKVISMPKHIKIIDHSCTQQKICKNNVPIQLATLLFQLPEFRHSKVILPFNKCVV